MKKKYNRKIKEPKTTRYSKAEKLFLISQSKYKISQKSIKKLMRYTNAWNFAKKLKQVESGYKGYARKKVIYSEAGVQILKRQETLLIDALRQDPSNKKIQKEYFKNTKRLNRFLETNPNLTPEEKESMIDRHQRRENDLMARIHRGEEITTSKHGLFIEDFIDQYFSTDFESFKESYKEEQLSKLESGTEEYNDKKQELDNISSAEWYQIFWDEDLSRRSEAKEAEQGNGWIAFEVEDDKWEIIYDN